MIAIESQAPGGKVETANKRILNSNEFCQEGGSVIGFLIGFLLGGYFSVTPTTTGRFIRARIFHLEIDYQ